MDNWILIAILGGLSSNLGNLLFRYILKDGDDSIAYAWFHEAFRVIIFLSISLYSFSFVFDIKGALPLVGLGIVEFIAAYFLMKMHEYSHLSISTIISRTRLIWVPVIAYFLFRETLQSYEYIGIMVLFLGLSIATSPHKIIADKGIKYAYLSAFTIAFVNILMKSASPFTNTNSLMVFMSFPSVILFPIAMTNPKKRIFRSLRTNTLAKIVTGLVNALSMFLLAKAIGLGPVSKVTALYQSMMITSVIAGIVLLHEREDIGKKIVGSIISLVGVILLTSN